MKQLFIFLLLCSLFACNNSQQTQNANLNVRLQWFPHAQFAGYIVALQKGFYKEVGLNVTLLPAGPDIKPTTTVASGSDDIGIGVPNQIITARANGVPLTVIAQIFQDSPNRYVIKSADKIDSLPQLKGKKIGLWLGGDEAEFVSMLKTFNMQLTDMNVIAQEYSVAPFLENQYILSQVTTYNELNQIRNAGYEGDKLQVLSPKDYNSAILGDMIFCKEDFIKSNPEKAEKFLIASIRGWKYTIEHPDEALDIVLKYNPELKADEQRQTMQAIISLIKTGKTLTEGIGYIDENDYKNTERILLQSGQLKTSTDIKKTYTLDIWNKVSADIKKLK